MPSSMRRSRSLVDTKSLNTEIAKLTQQKQDLELQCSLLETAYNYERKQRERLSSCNYSLTKLLNIQNQQGMTVDGLISKK